MKKMNMDHEVTEYFAEHDYDNETLRRLNAPVKRRRNTEQGRGEGRSQTRAPHASRSSHHFKIFPLLERTT